MFGRIKGRCFVFADENVRRNVIGRIVLLPLRRGEREGHNALLPLHKDAFGVFDVEFLVNEPFGGWATAVTDIVLPTAGTGTTAHLPIIVEQGGVAPYLLEGMFMQIARLEFGSLEEGTGIDFAFGADTAGRGRRATDIETGELIAKGVEVEE